MRGFDVNGESVEAARRMLEIQGVSNGRFEAIDVRDVDAAAVGTAEFVLLYGLLYHAEDPMRMLRLAASLTADTLLIETQVTGFDIKGSIEWGTYQSRKPVLGLFALIDDDHNREGGNTGLALVPSVDAVRSALLRLGFIRADLVTDFNAETEQLRRGQRVIIAAHR